jgi:hypothetical protein
VDTGSPEENAIADRSLANNADPSIWAPFVFVGEGG